MLDMSDVSLTCLKKIEQAEWIKVEDIYGKKRYMSFNQSLYIYRQGGKGKHTESERSKMLVVK